MPKVFSKLSSSQKYTGYQPPVDKETTGVNTIQNYVLIHGGANIADKNLHTPMGVMTTITDDEAAFLEQNHVFKIHKKNRMVIIESDAANKGDVEAVVSDMGDTTDPSSPMTPSDFKDADGVVGDDANGQARVKDAKKK